MKVLDESAAPLNHPSESALSQLTRLLQPNAQPVRLGAGDDLRMEPLWRGNVFRLREGMLHLKIEGRTVLFLDQGSVLVPAIFSHLQEASLESDFGTILDCYSDSEIAAQVAAGGEFGILWSSFLQGQVALLLHLLSKHVRGEVDVSPEVSQVQAGKTIILQGELTDRVYTLLQGRAEVTVDGEHVGEIEPDEIFGVVGALCQTPRMATVTATEDTLLFALPRERFNELLTARPAMVIKMIEDMARVVDRTNRQLVDKAKEKAAPDESSGSTKIT